MRAILGTIAMGVIAPAVQAEPEPKTSTRGKPMPTTTGPAVAVDDGFARRLFARLAVEPGNVVVSPASVESCVALALAGARGQTAAQIVETLGLTPAERNDPGLLIDRYRTPAAQGPSNKDDPSALVVANSAWVQKGFPIHAAYRELLATNDRATFELVDFATQTEAARLAINAWVDVKTQHKIKELLAPGVLDSSARLVLANAIYFKGRWLEPFDKDATQDQPFHRPDAADVTVPLMHRDARYKYLETESYQAVQLPYVQGDLSMAVWLPRSADGLADMEREICTQGIANSLAKLRPSAVDLYVPRFKLDEQSSLGEALVALGMKDAFSPRADFSGISDQPLSLSAVVHQALVEVDEEGTEAAAATGAIAVTSAALPDVAPKKIFRADHPFVFAIRNHRSGDVYFMGRMAKPK
jgi:serpin B